MKQTCLFYDCMIFVKSLRAGQRVMESITSFIEKKLRLKVNKSKSKVALYKEVKHLGFGFYYSPQEGQIRIRVHKNYVLLLLLILFIRCLTILIND